MKPPHTVFSDHPSVAKWVKVLSRTRGAYSGSRCPAGRSRPGIVAGRVIWDGRAGPSLSPAESPAVGWSNGAPTELLVETVDVLDHVPADTVGMRGLGANPDEPRTGEHLGGADVVFGDAREQRPRQLDPSERVEGR